ncbi:OB-fold protein [Stenotrophomonas maltophilia]|jgi:hypothetical protein|uniref:OB-fold protein n=2 Tax=Stenotrophomonas maltophilia TaxID=40324 RepID=UPI000B4DFEB8|nr:hypothetical protein [Stenotrophomonas maltophilia]OWQ59828.1 hypothetical protein CEE59_06060 [Stenotrophomonas maltophilia]HDS1140549.1 hypothetical protein [Stenotrophomonas maltophilia]HEL3835379.1 hypothetical protein [Stenotrophomonas maltophilia]HEL3839996.1 hypothetical protein [Stenotrophomonas maltophilia]HEL3844615.1 hypothetical protein [Stenotrophomonas maltophilia]
MAVNALSERVRVAWGLYRPLHTVMSLISTVLILAAAAHAQPPLAVDSTVLLAAYTRDAAAADRRYMGQRLRVTGVVAEEPTLYRRSPLLSFEGTGIHDRPVAVLDPARKDELAGLRSGQSVTLDCLGNGHVSGTPMLKNCVRVPKHP